VFLRRTTALNRNVIENALSKSEASQIFKNLLSLSRGGVRRAPVWGRIDGEVYEVSWT